MCIKDGQSVHYRHYVTQNGPIASHGLFQNSLDGSPSRVYINDIICHYSVLHYHTVNCYPF